MRRAVVGAAVVVLGLLMVLVVAVVPSSAGTPTWTLRDRFSREVVRPGDVDASPYAIEHVTELQHRLTWLGYFDQAPTGYYGPVTKAAVMRFQHDIGVPATGMVGYRTWKPLIQRTVRGRHDVPRGCLRPGRHACYDRQRHQVNLYRDGRLLNSWLVRGGAWETPTRLGTFRVYWRHIDHVSTLFGAPMPYAQFFSGGQALHGSRLMMDPYVGHSHGCVNFYVEDARQLWNLTVGHPLVVHVYGPWG
jgi:hypothetical protein